MHMEGGVVRSRGVWRGGLGRLGSSSARVRVAWTPGSLCGKAPLTLFPAYNPPSHFQAPYPAKLFLPYSPYNTHLRFQPVFFARCLSLAPAASLPPGRTPGLLWALLI